MQQNELQKQLDVIIGKRLDSLNLACDMMMFRFGDFALHAQCLVRVIRGNDILATTLDYQSWDGENESNNDEWFFVERYKDSIVGGSVVSVHVSAVHDVVIELDHGVRIELFVANGHCHFEEEQEQWVFFRHHDHAHPFVTVKNKTVDIAAPW